MTARDDQGGTPPPDAVAAILGSLDEIDALLVDLGNRWGPGSSSTTPSTDAPRSHEVETTTPDDEDDAVEIARPAQSEVTLEDLDLAFDPGGVSHAPGPPGPNHRLRHGIAGLFAALVVLAVWMLVAWHVAQRVKGPGISAGVAVYTVIIGIYVLSRFILAGIYRPPTDAGIEPTVAVIVPSFNEGAAVARTIEACAAVDYPDDSLEIVCVDDGSADDTLEHARRAADAVRRSVHVVALGTNQGKRAAMAAGIRCTDAEILVFVDSDSLPGEDAVRKLVQGFADERVGAVSGLTYVRNAHANMLTRMQAARYYVSFQLLKAAESAVGAVACCSGCFAAYRRTAVLPVLERWEHQRFLGTECTYGDDRSLTNMIIRTHWITRYHAGAEAWTDAPDRYPKFFKQQLRWKKSWLREGPILLTHVWRTRPLALPSVLVATLAGLLSPFLVLLHLLWAPLAESTMPLIYLLGLYLIAVAYGMFYRAHRRDDLWPWAVVGTFFYLAFSAQLLWAMLRVRDGAWGTRGT